MEVIVAILLLFGAFSLGSATGDDADDHTAGVEIPATAYERQDVTGNDLEASDAEHAQVQDCFVDRHVVIHRDLTVPHENEIEAERTGAGDSEEAYPYE